MKILITGAGGFIASRLCAALDDGVEVFAHTRNSASLVKIPKNVTRSFYGDLAAAGSLDDVPDGIELVLHAAGIFSSGTGAEEMLGNNLLGTLAILHFMEKRRIPRLIFLSSAAVYGESAERTAREYCSPEPITAYGFAKLASELVIRQFIKEGRIQSGIAVRPNNVYGEGVRHGMIYQILSKVAADKQVEVDGDGGQIREPLYVDDLIKLLLVVIKRGKGDFSVYNASGQEHPTVLELIQKIADVAGKNPSIAYSGKAAGLPRVLTLDCTRAREDFGWEPHTMLGEGLTNTYRAFA